MTQELLSISGYELIGHFNSFETGIRALPQNSPGSPWRNRNVQEAAKKICAINEVDLSETDPEDAYRFLIQMNKAQIFFKEEMKPKAFKRLLGLRKSQTKVCIELAFDHITRKFKTTFENLRNSHPERVMKVIRKDRLEDANKELARLRIAGVMTPSIEEKIHQAIDPFKKHLDENDFLRMKVMLGQLLEIRQIYGSTHDIFAHGQSSEWLIYPDLIKEIEKRKNPEKNLQQFKFLRLPSNEEGSIERYSKNEEVNDHDPTTRYDLISADGYLFSNYSGESALDFIYRNSNLLTFDQGIGWAVFNALQRNYPAMQQNDIDKYRQKIYPLAKKSKLGNLFVFCVPKEKSASIVYRSHSGGTPCRCHLDDRAVLDELHQDKATAKCSYGAFPQFRIYAPALKKENGVKVYLLASNWKARKEEKEGIKIFAQEIHDRFGSSSVTHTTL